MLGLIGKLFAWWDGATPGTFFTIARSGAYVGKDDFGNKYYQERKASGAEGQKRRWIVYNGYADASRVPADWHGWLHHTFEDAPIDAPLRRQAWELDHKPNMTGTVFAYRPTGSLAGPRKRQATSADYESWAPED